MWLGGLRLNTGPRTSWRAGVRQGVDLLGNVGHHSHTRSRGWQGAAGLVLKSRDRLAG
jgi:hypothetical protein